MAVPDIHFVLNFLDKVKRTFIYKPKKYRRLQILWQKYLNKDNDCIELLNGLSRLLSDDPSLIEAFNELLPLEFKLFHEKPKKINLKRPHSEKKMLDPHVKRAKYVGHLNEETYSMYGSWDEFSFFDKAEKLLGNDCTYLNFLRCVELFNKNLIDGIELLEILQSFVGKSPNLMTQLKAMLHHHLTCKNYGRKKGSQRRSKVQSLEEEIREYEIDFSSCRKIGSSYRALKSQPDDKPLCSGRTDLCKQVLNDIWVSFPLWSEDPASTSESQGGCKITSIQEFFYKCEDERFELDIVIDQLSSAINTLEEVQSRMNSMSQEQIMTFQLDDSLGGSSQVLQKKVIERIYGDKAKDLLDGLKLKPFIGVPIALRRLKAKQQEWMEHRIKFNKIWKENTEKHSQRALNCELSSVKQNDHKDARTKVIINEVEAIHEESLVLSSIYGNDCLMTGKHFVYSDKEILDDLNDLVDFNLECLSERGPDDGSNGATPSAPCGSASTLPPLLLTDEAVLSFCKKALKLFRMSSEGSNCEAAAAAVPWPNSRDEFDGVESSNGGFLEGDAAFGPPGTVENDDSASAASSRTSAFPDETVMYQNGRWLVAVSLHHKIYSRLSKIHKVSERESLERDDRRRSRVAYTDIGGREECDALYSFAVASLRSCLRGTCESGVYEEHVRKTMARLKNESSFNYNDVSYWIISLDKLLKNFIRELQQLAADEVTRKGMELFETFHFNENKLHATSHMAYRHKSLDLLSRDLCYKFTFKKKWQKIVVELVDSANAECSKEAAEEIERVQTWQEYISDFINGEVGEVESMPFMKRNVRKDVPADLVVSGSDQFAFRPNSFKLVFSSLSHSILHRTSRICTLEKSLKRHAVDRSKKFFRLWSEWQSLNVTPLHEQKFSEWTLGPKKSQVKTVEISNQNIPPYRTYKKYLYIHKP